MNTIELHGIITNINKSHIINGVEYDKANLIVKREDGTEDSIDLKFKSLSNHYKEGQNVELVGNVRSYSNLGTNGKNSVRIYVFTYFDRPEETIKETITTNMCKLDGRICKVDKVRKTNDGKISLHFILANNIVKGNNQKLNSYIPCVLYGDKATKYSELKVNDIISIDGELHSREYVKNYSDGSSEIKVAHELVVDELKKL